MSSSNKALITPKITSINDKFLILSEVQGLDYGAQYLAQAQDDSRIVFLNVYYDYPLKEDSDYVALQDQFFAYSEVKHESLQKASELMRTQFSGQPHMIPVLVLEKPVGVSAASLLKTEEGYRFHPVQAVEYMIQICECMQILSQSGYVHGSLNPENLFFDPDGKFTLINVPFLRNLWPKQFVVLPAQESYTAPEIYAQEMPSAKSDVYALGCILHQFLEGSPPFLGEAQKEAHLEEECPGLNGIASGLNKLMLQMLSKKAAARPDQFNLLSKKLAQFKKKGTPKALILFLALLIGISITVGWLVLSGDQQATSASKAAEVKANAAKKAKSVKKEEPKAIPPEEIRGEPIEGMAFFGGGKFRMGGGRDEDSPLRETEISPFYIDLMETTNAEYAAFLKEKGRKFPAVAQARFDLWNQTSNPTDKMKRQPVILLSWDMAKEYCEHMSKRLPTEAEWEFAARGREERAYPWGDKTPEPNMAQYSFDWKGEDTLFDVDFFQAGRTPEGVFNMLGGVAEWVSDFYSKTEYKDNTQKNPTGPKEGTKRVLRGGAWDGQAEGSHVRDSALPSDMEPQNGVRCAKSWQK